MPRRLTLILISVLIAASALAAVNIWEETPGHERVELTPYIATGDVKPVAVIVCPGGSYFWHDINVEGHDVARWLQQNGITAFVLKYRAGGVWAFVSHYRLLCRGHRYPDPQDDLLQALRYVRSHAGKFGIDPAELFPQDERPAFVAPLYPVVTMTHECVHKRSRRGLLGDSKTRDAALRDTLSLELHVPADCPPVFLVNCVDDPIVDYRNSVLLDSALTAQGVKHVYLQYRTGGHGFGASDTKGTAECRQWKEKFLEWITTIY